MPTTYYQVDLSPRALTVLVVALALVMVVAFALGYGAAWSTLRTADGGPAPVPVEVVATPTPVAVAALATATPAATVVPPAVAPSATPAPSPPLAPTPLPTATPPPAPTAAPVGVQEAYWVQVVAAGNRRLADRARAELERLGFPPDHQQLLEEVAANGRPVYKVRVGPLPDRDSANRVAQRLRAAGHRDAWIVVP